MQNPFRTEGGEIFIKDDLGNEVKITSGGSIVTPEGLAGFPSLIVEKSEITTNKVISSVNPTYEDTGMSVTITTLANEDVVIGYVGDAAQTGGTGTGSFWLAYQIDGGTDIPVFAQTTSLINLAHNVSFAIPITGLTAGIHTIKLRASRNVVDWSLIAVSGNRTPIFYSVQYRGAGLQGIETTEMALVGEHTIAATFPAWEQVGSVEVNVTTLKNERVMISFQGAIQQTSSPNTNYRLGYQIDSDSVIHVVSSGNADGTNAIETIGFNTMSAALDAGIHTIKLMVASSGGAGKVMSDTNLQNAFQVTRFRTSNLGPGTIVTEDTVGANIVAGNATSYTDVGPTVTITTAVADEEILMSWSGWYRFASGIGGDHLRLALQVDSDSEILVLILKDVSASNNKNGSFIMPLTIATPGSHVIKLRYFSSSVGTAYDIQDGLGLALGPATFKATQYRGGVIPIRDDGSTIVERPIALDFLGAQITDESGVAKITFPNAALGGYTERILNNLGSNLTNTNTSYAAINGIDQQTFTTPVTGDHTFRISFAGNQSTGTVSAYFRIVIDKGLSGEVIIGDNDEWRRLHSSTDSFEWSTFEGFAGLAAGQHTADFEMKVTSNTFVRTSGSYTQCIVQAQGSGINGLEVVEVRRANDFTVTAVYSAVDGAGMQPVTDMSVTINTLEGERVEVKFVGSARTAGPDTSNDLILGYRIDGGTPVAVEYSARTSSSNASNCSFSVLTDILTAGQHTIELTASSSTGQDPAISGYSGTIDKGTDCRLQVVRHKSNGIGAGTVVESDILGVTKNISSATYEDTGLETTITTVADETVLLNFVGEAKRNGSIGFIYWAYSLDGGVDVPLFKDTAGSSGETVNSSFSMPILISAAGGHTIKLRARVDSSSFDILVDANDQASLHAIQYRGGLIPIKNASGLEIVPKPVAIEFGEGASVTDVNGVARVDFPNAANGGYQEVVVDDIPAGNEDNTNTSFAAVTGISQTSFTTPVTGPHTFTLMTSAFSQGGSLVATYRIVIDKGTGGEQILGSGDLWKAAYIITSAIHGFPSYVEIVDLAAGTHTVDIEVKVSANTMRRNANSLTRVLVQALGTGINGLEVVEDELLSNFAITSTYPTYEQLDTVQVVVNTLENERVQLSFYGGVLFTGTGNFNGRLGYQVDSDTVVEIMLLSVYSTNPAIVDDGFCVMTAPLSAGQHTIKLMTARSGSGTAITWQVGGGRENIFRAIQFKSFGIGAGTIVDEDTIPGNFTTALTSFQDTGFELTFITIADEWVDIKFIGDVSNSAGASDGMRFKLNIDTVDETNDLFNEKVDIAADNRDTICFSKMIGPLSAGSHTVKLRAATQTGAGTMFIGSTRSLFQVVQHRGGVIPIMDETSVIVDKPSALDFAGTGVTVTAVGAKALITIPGNVPPLITLSGMAEDSTHLGTFIGSTIPDSRTIKQALQDLETEVELKETVVVVSEIDTNVNDLISLSGVAENATDLGTFTGTTIPDSQDTKAALQALETAHENATTNITTLEGLKHYAPSEKHSADSSAAAIMSEHIFVQAQNAFTVTKVFYLPDTSLIANDTNYATLTVYRRDISGGTQVIVASITTQIAGGSGNWTAFDGLDLGTIANAAIASGQVLTWEITKTASGVIVPAGTLQVEYTID